MLAPLLADQEALNQLRQQFCRAVIDLHQSLAAATTAKQWKSAGKR